MTPRFTLSLAVFAVIAAALASLAHMLTQFAAVLP